MASSNNKDLYKFNKYIKRYNKNSYNDIYEDKLKYYGLNLHKGGMSKYELYKTCKLYGSNIDLSPIIFGGMTSDDTKIEGLDIQTLEQKTLQSDDEDNYSINIFWVRDNNDSIPSKQIEEKITNAFNNWNKTNPGKVNLWVDDVKLYNDIRIDRKYIKNFKDIKIDGNSPKNISYNTMLTSFLDDKIEINGSSIHKYPVFLRVDYIKNLIAHEELKQKKYVVLTDLDIGIYNQNSNASCFDLQSESKIEEKENIAFNKDFLFDEDTMQQLNKYGFIMACSAPLNKYENSFMIFKNTVIIKSLLEKYMIKYVLDIITATEFNESLTKNLNSQKNNKSKKLIPNSYNIQHIYRAYKKFFNLLYAQINNIMIYSNNEHSIDYLDAIDKDVKFNNENDANWMTRSLSYPMPMKKILLPKSQFSTM